MPRRSDGTSHARLSYGTFEHSVGVSDDRSRKHTQSSTRRDTMSSHDEEDPTDTTKVADDDGARQGTCHEHSLSLIDAIKLYPTAVGWSIYFSLGVIMASFDPQLLGNLYATPAFQRDFGYRYNGSWIISAPWQTGLSMGSPAGQVIGALFASYPMEWFGRKKTFGACVVLTSSFVFIQFFARSLPVLLIGELLGGLILGLYVVVAPAYASEVCPVALRGILTSWINLSFVTGQLIANGVIAGTSRLENHWAYSAPFAAQWFWPLLILVIFPFAPESPYWLVRQNRLPEAELSLRRLASASVDIKPTLAMIISTDALERTFETGSSYKDCFNATNLRRTEISIGVYAIQVLSGIYLVSYATYFFELAGLPTSSAFNMSVIFLAVGFVGTICSWILLSYFGRRQIYTTGLAGLIILLLLIGILDCMPHYTIHPSLAWTQSILMLAWNFTYDLTIGPVCFVLICETSATRVRSKTIALATAVQGLVAIGMTVAIPFLLNPDQANGRGKIGFFFGGLSMLALGWAWLRVPETKGRTYEELDAMFARGVGAREFEGYRVEDE